MSNPAVLSQCRAVDWELEGVEAALELIWSVSVRQHHLSGPGQPTHHPLTILTPHWAPPPEQKKKKKKKKKFRTGAKCFSLYRTDAVFFSLFLSLCLLFFFFFLWRLRRFFVFLSWSLWDEKSALSLHVKPVWRSWAVICSQTCIFVSSSYWMLTTHLWLIRFLDNVSQSVYLGRFLNASH